MRRIKQVILLVFLSLYGCCPVESFAQRDSYTTGLLFNGNFSLSGQNGWSTNLKTEARELLLRGDFGQAINPVYFHERALISLGGNKKVAERHSVGLIYMLQHLHSSTGFQFAHRLSAQYVYSRNYTSFRCAHRAQIEANYRPHRDNVYRLRYRFAIELPLSGAAVDVHEYYIRATSELLFTLPMHNNSADGELRAAFFMGNRISKNQKLELGFDYRISRLAQAERQHQFWLNVAYFVAFKMDKAKK